MKLLLALLGLFHHAPAVQVQASPMAAYCYEVNQGTLFLGPDGAGGFGLDCEHAYQDWKTVKALPQLSEI